MTKLDFTIDAAHSLKAECLKQTGKPDQALIESDIANGLIHSLMDSSGGARSLARTLTDGVKGRDISARYGGEEFAILLPETPLDAGVHVGNALRKAVATKDVINRNTGEKLGRITMSVGVAEYKNGENIHDTIERADAALYTAKHNGRNRCVAYSTLAPAPVASQVSLGRA